MLTKLPIFFLVWVIETAELISLKLVIKNNQPPFPQPSPFFQQTSGMENLSYVFLSKL